MSTFPVEIIYEDEYFLVVNKPSGLATIPGGWVQNGSPLSQDNLVGILETQFGKLWVVHRLDKGTSGVLIFARTVLMHRVLSIMFETREVTKTYHAIVMGIPLWEDRTAHHPLRANVGHGHRTMVDHRRGKSATTNFHVLERFSRYSHLSAVPGTGRTHQIRVHAAALGFPILGDALYGAPSTDLISRPALHSYSLEFTLDGQPRSFIAPYPQDFQFALEKIRTG